MVSRNIYIKSFLFYYEIVFGAIIFVNKNMFGAIKDSACVSYTFLTPFTPLHFHYYQSTMNSLSPMLHYFYASVATSLPLLLCIATILFGVSCIGTLKQNKCGLTWWRSSIAKIPKWLQLWHIKLSVSRPPLGYILSESLG